MDLLKCKDCQGIFNNVEVLRGINPFNKNDVISGCPLCFTANPGFEQVCDQPGCTDVVECGTPTPNGYRSTCSAHMPKE